MLVDLKQAVPNLRDIQCQLLFQKRWPELPNTSPRLENHFPESGTFGQIEPGIMSGKCQYARIWPLPAGVIRSLRCIVPFPPVRHLHPRGIARPPVMVACRRLETSRVSLTPQFLLSPTVPPSFEPRGHPGRHAQPLSPAHQPDGSTTGKTPLLNQN